MPETPLPYRPINPKVFFPAQKVIRFLAGLWIKDFRVEGLENIPMTGKVIVSVNHMSMMDTPLHGMYTPRIGYLLAAEKYEHSIFRPILDIFGAIYIDRGEVDREALRKCMAVLNDGNLMGIAIEGTRSKSNTLEEGKTGIAYLASRTQCPVIPAVIFGTERMIDDLKHLRRTPEVIARIGQSIEPPPNRARTAELETYTEKVMLAMAALLPERYRGRWADHPLFMEDEDSTGTANGYG